MRTFVPSSPELDLAPFRATVCWYNQETVDGRIVVNQLEVHPLPLAVLSDPEGGCLCGSIESYVDDGKTLEVFGYIDRGALPTQDNPLPPWGMAMDLGYVETEIRGGDDRLYFTAGRLMGASVSAITSFPDAHIVPLWPS